MSISIVFELPQGISQLKDSFVDLTIKHFEQIAADHYKRKQSVENASTDSKIEDINAMLGKGLWYPPDYYLALNKFKQTKRLTWLISHNTFYHGYAPASFFEHVEDTKSPSKKRICTFDLKKGVSPTTALEALNKEFSLIDCGTALNVACLFSLREVIGEEKFNFLFEYDSPFRLRISPDCHSINRLFQRVVIEGEDSIERGDLCSFENIANQYKDGKFIGYTPKHPAEAGRALNVLCVSNEIEKKYLGLGLSPEGVNSNGIKRTLFELFNDDPIEEGIFSKQLWEYIYQNHFYQQREINIQLINSLKTVKITWEEFQGMQSRNGTIEPLDLVVLRPDVERIEQLVQAPLENIREVFARFS